MHSNRVIRQLSEVVYEESPIPSQSPVPPAPHPSDSPSNNLREVASNALSNYLNLAGAIVHHQDHVFSNPSNVIVANNPGNKDELERPATLALIGSGAAQQLHSSSSAFHYSAAASPYASSPYSEPSTPASSLTSSNFLHVPGYPNAYAGISPTLEFGMFWNTPWPFATAASHSLATSATTAIGQSEMISPGDLPSSLVEVAASHYHNQGQFLPPSSTSNQFISPSSNFRVQQHLHTATNPVLDSPVSTHMTRGQGMRTTPASTRRGGRRPREVEDDNHSSLTEEDKDKRDKRRQRNKEAAARCRKRRLDQMATLQKQVDELREGSRQQQVLIEQLTMEKDHIENILNQHSSCKLSPKSHVNDSGQSMLAYVCPSNSSMQQQRLGVQHPMITSFKSSSSPALTEQCLNASAQRVQHQHNIEYFKEELMMESSPSSQYTNTNSHSMIMDNDNDPVISDVAVGKKNRSKQDDRGLRECSELSADQYDAYGNQSHDGHERPKTLFDNATMRGNPAFEPNVISTPSNGVLDTPCYPAFLLESRTGLTPVINGPMQITNGPMHSGVNGHTSNMPPHNGDLRDL